MGGLNNWFRFFIESKLPCFLLEPLIKLYDQVTLIYLLQIELHFLVSSTWQGVIPPQVMIEPLEDDIELVLKVL